MLVVTWTRDMVEVLRFAFIGVALGVLLAPAKSLSVDSLQKEPRCCIWALVWMQCCFQR